MSLKNITSWWQRAFNGPQSLGRGKVFWISFWAVTAILYLYPLLRREYEVNNLAYFLSGLFLALGLSLIWGHGDVLSFGQMAFFGMGGYAYGIIGINLIEKTGNTRNTRNDKRKNAGMIRLRYNPSRILAGEMILVSILLFGLLT